MKKCNRVILSQFINNQLDEENRLDFLLHLDECPSCWEAVYNATKSQHPEYYKRPIRRKNQVDLELEVPEKSADQADQEIFEVA